jgi:sugar lactone lactonase YvrE
MVGIFAAAEGTTPGKATITASVGGVSQSIQLDVKPSPPLVRYLDLPALWTIAFGDVYRITGGSPVASAADQSGNLYLAYSAPVSEIKKVSTGGVITTFAHVGNPGSLAFGPNGVLYAVDTTGPNTFAIRRIAPDGSMSTLTQTARFDYTKGTFDGPSGVATAASLSIAVAPDGTVYATDMSRVRKIAPDGSFSTFAGDGCEYFAELGTRCADQKPVDGRGTLARFHETSGIVTDAAGNLYVSDSSLIRKITPAGEVSTLAGSTEPGNVFNSEIDGTGSAARFDGNGPFTIDRSGNLYKLGIMSGRLRKITPAGVVSTVAKGDYFAAVQPQRNVVSLYAGIPGVVVLQSSEALIKVAVE